MVEKCKFNTTKYPIFSTISFLVIIVVFLFADSLISNFSLCKSKTSASLHKESDQDHARLILARELFKKKLPEFEIFDSSILAKHFDERVKEFLNDQCKITFFYTWISPAGKFGKREFFAMESIFSLHPNGCLVIVSRTMDSLHGRRILKPMIDQGYRILVATPDYPLLLENTPGKEWFSNIKKGVQDPGKIPFAQNLSNFIRLALLYKYGGVYLDTDYIVLNDFSKLRNSIGVQSASIDKKVTRLNNAVLVFDKKHSLLHKFMEEFVTTFNGNIWGHNGPYMVSRVVEREVSTKECNFTVLPKMAFYPVDWKQITSFFAKPNGTDELNKVTTKLFDMYRKSYGVHLWNRETKKLNIEEGSVMERLISDHCIICKDICSS